MRTFLIPKTGIGRRDDPRRPRHVEGLSWTGMDDEAFYLVHVEGTTQQLDDLAAQPAVVEIPDDDEPLAPQVKARAAAINGGKVNIAAQATGRQLIASMKTGIAVNQVVRGIPPGLRALVRIKLGG
jgi:hypothetical protein